MKATSSLPEPTSSGCRKSDSPAPGANSYFLWQRHGEPIRLSLDQAHNHLDGPISYLTKTLKILEKVHLCKGLTFYLVYHTIRKLPNLGPNVVIIVYGDESCRIPPFCDDVKAVFKCYGYRPVFCDRLRPSYLVFLASLQFTRNAIFWVPGWLRYRVIKRHSLSDLPVYTIPLGYSKQLDLTIKKFANRRFTVSFIGSLRQTQRPKGLIRRILGTPKEVARRRMLVELTEIPRRQGRIKIYCGLTQDYHSGQKDDGKLYSEILMDTKICLCPRGTSHETFRFFEAMRFGCVIICDGLPGHWFYEGSPVIRVGDWQQLSQIVLYYEQRPYELQRLHEQTLAWWNQKCSEGALAAFMATALADAS